MTFEPFQKVLVRDNDHQQWTAALYSHERGDKYVCSGLGWKCCIPYEGNEHLLGTAGSTEQVEFAFGEHVEVSVNTEGWCKAIYISSVAGADTGYRTRYKVLDINGVVSLWEHCRKAEW